MTWYIDSDTGTVYDHSGAEIGSIDGPPYTIPDDIREMLYESLPNDDDSSVTVGDLKAVLKVASGDVQFGTPPD
jgi:hypothetical protein